MAYLLTASRSSSVRIACKANILSAHHETLVTVSSNVITLHQPGSLAIAQDIVCYGRLATLTPFRPAGETVDHLLLTTEDHKFFTLSFAGGKVITGVTGDLSTPGLTTPESGQKVLVSKDFIILYVHNGIVTLLPLKSSKSLKKRAADGGKLFGEIRQLRLNELKIHEIALLGGHGEQTVFGVLFRDQQLQTQFKSYEVVTRKGSHELREGPLQLRNLEHGTSLILSEDTDLVYCVGESVIYSKSLTTNQTESPLSVPTLYNSKTRLADGSWILGDDYGLLYRLQGGSAKPSLSIIKSLASISIPAVLVALNDELFIGSHYGDSQLLKYPSLDILDTKINIGPIQDIIVQPPQGAGGSSSLITASGAYKDGSMRLIKYGVGMTATAELDMPNVRGIWGIDDLAIIVLTFIDSFLVLQVSADGEFSQLEAGDDSILYACSINRKLFLVTKSGIRISDDGVILKTHSLEDVMLAKHTDNRMYVLSAGHLICLLFNGEEVTERFEKPFEEISAFEVALDSVIIGFWNSTEIWIGTLSLEPTAKVSFDQECVPTSILLRQFKSISNPILLVGMNDGSLLSYTFSDNTLSAKKHTVLGTTPVMLHSFLTKQGPNVFAVSDRPTIIYSLRSKLAFSGINIPSCEFFTAFNSSSLQSCMIVVTSEGLRIGSIDDIQRLQFKTVVLGELPRRLINACGCICALTMRLEVEEITGNEMQRSFLKLFDTDTVELRAQCELKESEICQSMCRLGYDDQEWIVVGTSFADSEEDECSRGRIIIFGVHESDSTLWTYKEIDVPGSVYCIASMGSKLVAGINSFVRLYDVTENEILQISTYRSSTYAITLAAKDDYVLVGDLMKSISYLRITSEGLTEVARDYVPTWITSVNFFMDDTFIGSEAEGNLLLLQQSDSPLEENKYRLDRIGEFRYGEMVNRIVPGVITQPEESGLVMPHSLFGTVDGSIGIIGKIQGEHTGLLMTLQSNIGKVRPSVGGLSHESFRAYKCAGIENTEPTRFVDGDLMEEFLELTSEQQDSVVEGTGKTVAEVEKIIEDLSRLR